MNFPSKLLTQTLCFANRLRATADWHAHGCGSSPQTSRRCNGRPAVNIQQLQDAANGEQNSNFVWRRFPLHWFIRGSSLQMSCHLLPPIHFFFSPRCGCEATTPMKWWQIKWDDCRERGSRRSGCLLLDGSMLLLQSRSFLRKFTPASFPPAAIFRLESFMF